MIKPYNIATTQISDLIFQENLQQTPLKKPAAQSTKNFYLLGIVVGLFAEAVDLLVVLGVRALIAHILGHGSGHVFGDADAAAVEPIAADVAANVEPEENEFGKGSFSVSYARWLEMGGFGHNGSRKIAHETHNTERRRNLSKNVI